MEPTCGRRIPIRGRFNSRWWWKRTDCEGELNLSDVSLRTSERGKIIFAVDWSSVTDYCSIVKLLFQDRRREETTLFNPSTSHAMEKEASAL